MKSKDLGKEEMNSCTNEYISLIHKVLIEQVFSLKCDISQSGGLLAFHI